jgi:hypothetical protein
MEEVKDDSPYRRLWAAVLKAAIAEMEHREGRGAAAHWIFSQQSDIGSMRWICDVLDLDHRKLQTMCMSRAGRRRILHKEGVRE